MRTFHSPKEMAPYRRKEGYLFRENDRLLDICLAFDFEEDCDLAAGHMEGRDITAWNLNVTDLKAGALDVNNLYARDVEALDIDASELCARTLICQNLHVRELFAQSIQAMDIVYTGFCVADKSFVCRNILCMGTSPRHECLSGEIQFRP